MLETLVAAWFVFLVGFLAGYMLKAAAPRTIMLLLRCPRCDRERGG